MVHRPEWIEVDSPEGRNLWHLNREHVILLWKENDRSRVGKGVFHGGGWNIDGKHYPYGEGPVQPTHFMLLPPRPDAYADWEY